MKKHELLLTQLAEECVETAQRCSKAIRFTLEEVQPGTLHGLNNAERIIEEYSHILAVMHVLKAEGYLKSFQNDEAVMKKIREIYEWLEYSKKRGTIEE